MCFLLSAWKRASGVGSRVVARKIFFMCLPSHNNMILCEGELKIIARRGLIHKKHKQVISCPAKLSKAHRAMKQKLSHDDENEHTARTIGSESSSSVRVSVTCGTLSQFISKPKNFSLVYFWFWRKCERGERENRGMDAGARTIGRNGPGRQWRHQPSSSS